MERRWLRTVRGNGATMDAVERHLKYMTRQHHLTPGMRAILMDWLVEMSMEYGLHAETVYLSVVLVDRPLACAGYNDDVNMVVEKDKVQCAGW